MTRSLKDILILTLVTLGVTFLIWLPHLLSLENFFGLNFSEGFRTIYRNFDGLEYIVIAKSFYEPAKIALLPQSLEASYYASHFPGYSLLILVFAQIMGFLKSMLLVSLASTIASVVAFYFLVKDFKLTANPLLLSIIFLFLPARWLIVHSVGSSEPLFIFFVITALYFFLKYEENPDHKLTLQNNWLMIHLAGLAGLGAQITRPPGILLFIAFGIYILWKMIKKKDFNIFKAIALYHPLILIPLTLLGVFYWFSLSYHDFFAYFHSGDNIHLTFPPFQVFNKNQFWVGSIWLEDIVYIFILGLLGGLLLIKQKLYPLAFFVLTYLVASMLVVHRDIARYTLPVFPFLLIAFEKVLISKEFKIVLIIVALGIYLYAQNFLLANTAPIPNLDAFN